MRFYLYFDSCNSCLCMQRVNNKVFFVYSGLFFACATEIPLLTGALTIDKSSGRCYKIFLSLSFYDVAYLDGLPGDRVQVVVAEVQLLQSQEVVERSLVDEHQLVVVQDEVVELGHAAERVVAYPGQPVTGGGGDNMGDGR